MATSSASVLPDNTAAANFRAWATFIHNALITAGWTVTADTGQINLTTVASPGAISTSQGYEIWQSNDGVSPTIYMKLEYGSGPGAAANPAIWVTFGTGSNGSGTLTGQLGTRKTAYAQTANAVSSFACVAAGGTGWFTLAMFNGTSLTFGFAVERLKTSTGGEATTGFVFVVFGSTSSICASQTILASGTVPAAASSVGTVSVSGTKVVGSVVGLWPWIPYSQQVVYPNALAMGLVFAGDIAANTTFTITRYGSTHTYYTPQTPVVPDIVGNGWACAIRYE